MKAAKTSLKFLFAVGALVVVGSPASADFIKWYAGGGVAGYTGLFSGAQSVYQLTQGQAAANCPTPPLGCSGGSDVTAPSTQTFAPSGSSTVSVDVSASAGPAGSTPWLDLNPNFGGMGVGVSGAGDDQIEGTEVLRVLFATQVTLTGVGTLFDTPHGGFGVVPSATQTFSLSVDGAAFQTIQFGFANNDNGGALNLALTGTEFRFMQTNTDNAEFYVSALTYNAVPGPIVGAGLPGLILACGGLIALARRRRQLVA